MNRRTPPTSTAPSTDELVEAVVTAIARVLDAGLDRASAAHLARDLDVVLAPARELPAVPGGLRELGPGTAAHPSTAEEVVQVEAAESELRRLGLEELRVRHHGDLARLEAPRSDLASVTSEPLRGEVLRAVRSAGFRLVALDLGTVTDTPGV